MPKFKNARTGRVVDVPEQPTTRLHRPKRDRQWSAKINRMDRSKRWSRLNDDGSEPVAEPEGAEAPGKRQTAKRGG